MMEWYKNTIFFFKLFPKKETLLNYIAEIRRLNNNRQQILIGITAKKMKFSIKDFFGKYDQIRRKLWIWSNFLKKPLVKNFIFCAVNVQK